MLTWKPYRDTESVFYNVYLKEGAPTIIAALKDDEYKPKLGVKVKGPDGYEYSGKKHEGTDKDGKPRTLYWIERKKIQTLGDESQERIAHDSTNREYQDGAKRGHEENLKAWAAMTAAIVDNTNSIKSLMQSINALVEDKKALVVGW